MSHQVKEIVYFLPNGFERCVKQQENTEIGCLFFVLFFCLFFLLFVCWFLPSQRHCRSGGER